MAPARRLSIFKRGVRRVDAVTGWRLDAPAKAGIDGILRETITDPVGPEFMAPPARNIEP
jgi:hypothetical protein